jgi:ankyrin repeat protein
MNVLQDSLARDLLAAAHAGDLKRLRGLLDAGVDPTHVPSVCFAPALHHAVEAASVEVVQELLGRGCPPDIRDRAKQTALGTVVHALGEGRDAPGAARLKHIGELLMERGASPTGSCDSEHTALSLARAYGRPDLVTWLEAHAKAP